MKLTKFKVTNFRSVEDSGWIEVDAVTALIGVNESGKTNLLLPLWKLNPARDGEIQPTSDFPKIMFGPISDDPGKYPFITAEFTTDDAAKRIAEAAGIASEAAQVVQVTRFFDGHYRVHFPEYTRETTEATQWVREQLNATVSKVQGGKCSQTGGVPSTRSRRWHFPRFRWATREGDNLLGATGGPSRPRCRVDS